MLARFHPLVRHWFTETFANPSDPQQKGWPAMASGTHTLILAPTGTGKTLAAFLWELNDLIIRGIEEPLPNAVHLLYISPLKALNNDIQRNLDRPLADLRERFTVAGKEFPEIRVAVRTGDTPAAARARLLRKSPHILITTPESLNIMLTTLKGRGMFSSVRAVRRRDTRNSRHEARSTLGGDAGAAGGAGRTVAPANRSLGNAKASRRSRAVSRRV